MKRISHLETNFSSLVFACFTVTLGAIVCYFNPVQDRIPQKGIYRSVDAYEAGFVRASNKETPSRKSLMTNQKRILKNTD